MENISINIVRMAKNDLVDNTWLYEALTQGLKQAMTSIRIAIPGVSEVESRIKAIFDNFTRDGCAPQPILVIPNHVIQMLLPKDSIILTILYIPQETGFRIQVEIIKLLVKDNSRQD